MTDTAADLMDGLPAVAAVLVACTGDPHEARTAAMLRAALTRVTDWQGLEKAAVRQGMGGLLTRQIAYGSADLVPPKVRAAWCTHAVAVARRSLRMQRQLLGLAARFEEAGVPLAAFKGPVFSQQLYGDSTLRHFVDLDLLVPGAHVAEARRAALDAGFEDGSPLYGVSERTLHSAMQEIALHHPGTGLIVEIHWRVGPRFACDSLPAEDLVARSVPISLLGKEIPVLATPDVVLVLAVHAATHDWERLEDVAAMAAALRRLTPHEASELARRAEIYCCRRRLHLAVLLTSAVAGARAPRAIECAAREDAWAKDLAAAAGARLLWGIGAAATLGGGPVEKARREVRQARALDGAFRTLCYLWRRLFTPSIQEWSIQEAPRSGLLAAAATHVHRQRRLWRR